jgi:DNA replication and repair protein RecF
LTIYTEVIVERFRCSHFRNISFADLELSPGLNCFLGLNGAGKTSILEALHTLSRGRSFRTSSLDSLSQFDNSEFAIGVDGIDSKGIRRGVVFRKKTGELPRLSIDGARKTRISQVAELLPLQLIAPDCADLVMEGPAARRNFLDWGMFHVKPSFLTLSRDYSTALHQRNAWLKQSNPASTPDPWIDAIDRLGVQITTLREEHVSALTREFIKMCAMFDIELDLRLGYFRGWGSAGGEGLAATLASQRETDLSRGYTAAGPHRADLRIFADQNPIAQVASRGQAKLVAIALKLAQVALVNDAAAERTVVLFDELVAELDERHLEAVFATMEQLCCQVLLSAVDVSEKLQTRRLAHAKMFHVEHGVIRETLE